MSLRESKLVLLVKGILQGEFSIKAKSVCFLK